MRQSRLLGRTFRQPPADAHLTSHQLLVRAGLARVLEGGAVTWLPLGQRALLRIQSLVRDVLTRFGAQEVGGPAAAPLPILAGREVDSYRQLPLLLLQMTAQPAPLAGVRTGLFGAKEQLVGEIAAFGPSPGAGCRSEVESALRAVLGEYELSPLWAEAGPGALSALLPHAAGDVALLRCPTCGRTRERSWATTPWPPVAEEADLPMELVETPGCDTIASLAEFLGIPAERTLKVIFCSVQGQVTCVAVRGDRLVDDAKLARLLGRGNAYPSREEELEAVGAVGGYASPIGLDLALVRVVADLSVQVGRHYVSGANRAGFHMRNVRIPRDFSPAEWADVALAEAGDPCSGCGSPVELVTAFELARADAPVETGAEYQDEEGRAKPLWAAQGRLDLVRLLAAAVETHHDEYGIMWPIACAPLDIHLVALDLREEPVAAKAEALYRRLQSEGYGVLLDDREVSAGVKFNDADLIGLPLRLTLGRRWLADGQIEAKWRTASERLRIDDAGLAAVLARLRPSPAPSAKGATSRP